MTSRTESSQNNHLELLRILSEATGVPTDHATLNEVIERSSSLADAAQAIGLRLRPVVAPLSAVGPMARRELPVFTYPDGGGCWIIDGSTSKKYRVFSLDAPNHRRWFTETQLGQLIGVGTIHWTAVEPMLPASPLASPGIPRTPLARLGALFWMERRDVTIVMVYGLITGLLSLATPLAIQVLINWLAFGALIQPIILLGGVLFASLTLAAGLMLLQRVAIEIIERRIFVRMVSDLSARLSQVQPAALDAAYGPDLANRFFDVLTLQKATRSLLLDGFTAFLQIAVAIALLGLYNPWLLVFDLFLILGIAFVLLPLGMGAERTAIKESKAKYQIASWIEEIAHHSVPLRMNQAHIATHRAERLTHNWLERRSQHFRVVLRQYAGAQALHVSMSTVLLVACGVLVLRGQLTIGQLVAAEFIVNSALMGMLKFADKLDSVYDLLAGVDKLAALLDLPLEPATGLSNIGSGPSHLVASELITNQSELPVHLNLPPLSTTVIIGESERQITALAHTFVGLRAPLSGTVHLNGVAMHTLRPTSRYEHTALIEGADLLRATLRENIAMGNTELSDLQVWQALRDVGLQDLAEKMNLNTALEPSTHQLSTLEKASVLLARAIITNPRFIVVDRLLDSLRQTDRAALTQVLLRPSRTWTTLILTTNSTVAPVGARVFTHGAVG